MNICRWAVGNCGGKPLDKLKRGSRMAIKKQGSLITSPLPPTVDCSDLVVIHLASALAEIVENLQGKGSGFPIRSCDHQEETSRHRKNCKGTFIWVEFSAGFCREGSTWNSYGDSFHCFSAHGLNATKFMLDPNKGHCWRQCNSPHVTHTYNHILSRTCEIF